MAQLGVVTPSSTAPTCCAICLGLVARDLLDLARGSVAGAAPRRSAARRDRRRPRARRRSRRALDLAQPRRLGARGLALAALERRGASRRGRRRRRGRAARRLAIPSGFAMSVGDRARPSPRRRRRLGERDPRDGERVAARRRDAGEARDRLPAATRPAAAGTRRVDDERDVELVDRAGRDDAALDRLVDAERRRAGLVAVVRLAVRPAEPAAYAGARVRRRAGGQPRRAPPLLFSVSALGLLRAAACPSCA